MARLPYVRTEEISNEYPEIAARKINIYRTLAHNLECARAFGTLGKYIKNSSKIDARLRELVTLQVGLATDCAYEFYHHVKIAYQAGVSDSDIEAILAETKGIKTNLGDLDRAALRMARQLTQEVAVDDETYAAVARHLRKDQLIDLAITISHYNAAVRFLKCFEVDLEEGYETLLQKFPMPGVQL